MVFLTSSRAATPLPEDLQGGKSESSQLTSRNRPNNVARTACDECPSALTTTPPPAGRALSPT